MILIFIFYHQPAIPKQVHRMPPGYLHYRSAHRDIKEQNKEVAASKTVDGIWWF